MVAKTEQVLSNYKKKKIIKKLKKLKKIKKKLNKKN